ncbi:5-deoxy-glucuronate isomerase [Streptomyces phytohabitans]|uniref:5-deoxy-glucuronate isomerase n=1 Tax=Streptomyces phytohabitans TaxID=1150371 RepID=UPI00345BCF8A
MRHQDDEDQKDDRGHQAHQDSPGAPGRRAPRFHLPAGAAAEGPYALDVGPRTAGWGYSALRVLELPPGGAHEFATGDSEWIVLPLRGGCTVVAADGGAGDGADGGSDAEVTFELRGRESVFAGVSDFAYVPRDATVRVSSRAGGRFALTGARCTRRLPARYGPAEGVAVELRGSGNCSRQVNNFAAAGAFEADRLIAVEVLTPGGNWSSYPPHKHDEHRPGEESELEEIYYFEIAPHGATEGVGYQRVTPSGPGSRTDVLAEVRTGDTVLIPDGWHGPSIAAPGHDMYYLNVMAGPGVAREWLICDHPDHAWVRGTWGEMPVDQRLPLYLAPTEEGEGPS